MYLSDRRFQLIGNIYLLKFIYYSVLKSNKIIIAIQDNIIFKIVEI